MRRSETTMSSTGRLASASARHPWRVIAGWVAISVAAVVAIVALLGGSLTTEGEPTNNPESERAIAALIQAFPPDPSTSSTDIVVVRSEELTTDSPQFESFVRALVEESDVPALSQARTYLDGDAALVSADRHATIVPLAISDEDEAEAVIEAVAAADEDGAFAVAVTGDQTLDHDFNLLSQEDLEKGELQFGLPAALIILLLVFGAVVAGLVPLLMAIVSIVVALGMTAVVAQQFELSIFVVNMLTGMGLALGIDYSLFVVSRYREERGRGREQFDAIAASGLTASRAVLFSGTVFVVAMFGMLLVPNSIMRSLAVGAILVGIVSVAAALTLLPALLGLLGDRVNALRIPHRRQADARVGGHRGTLLGWDRPKRAPAPGAQPRALAGSARRARSADLRHERRYERRVRAPRSLRLQTGIRRVGARLPAGDDRSGGDRGLRGTAPEDVTAAVDRLRSQLAGDPRFGAGELRVSDDGAVSVLSVPVVGDPSSSQAVAAVQELRSELVPEAFEGTGAEVLVGGTTSENIDYFASVIDPAPLVIGLVLVLTFLFLTVVFRSVVVAATAVALNLLSVGAAYGLLVLVFQYGIGAEILGFQETDTIEAWVPLFLFSVLFGLSMDYQVFLLSRIRERYDETGDTTDAVTFGVGSTARIITGAALIIVAVFSGFARGDLIMFQQMGFGVAVALLIDATIIRSVVLPSVMQLLGRWNWYLPSWLEWLPRLEVEGSSAADRGRGALEPSRN